MFAMVKEIVLSLDLLLNILRLKVTGKNQKNRPAARPLGLPVYILEELLAKLTLDIVLLGLLCLDRHINKLIAWSLKFFLTIK